MAAPLVGHPTRVARDPHDDQRWLASQMGDGVEYQHPPQAIDRLTDEYTLLDFAAALEDGPSPEERREAIEAAEDAQRAEMEQLRERSSIPTFSSQRVIETFTADLLR